MGFFRDELGKTYDELSVGQKASFRRLVTKQDVLQYMGLSGDLNPLYADSAYAGRTKYDRPIVPANMLAGFAQGAVANVMPGLGSLTHMHTYRLVNPAVVGDEVTAEMEIVEMKAQSRHVVIRYKQVNQDGKVLLEGELEVEPPAKLKPILHHAYENF
ncbi:MAG TPA: MaoC/PaaZ C-terminal domain-containing protein [Symbiobacteriaceae bacterium]|nr:MaoC/PaaZ C-terminal domain-containing protein [Symbiobacteriaceae bacterium]